MAAVAATLVHLGWRGGVNIGIQRSHCLFWMVAAAKIALTVVGCMPSQCAD